MPRGLGCRSVVLAPAGMGKVVGGGLGERVSVVILRCEREVGGRYGCGNWWEGRTLSKYLLPYSRRRIG